MSNPKHQSGTQIHNHPTGRRPFLKPVSFDDLPGWHEDDHAAALICLLGHLGKPAPNAKSPRGTGMASLGISDQTLKAALFSAPVASALTKASAKAFFETCFEPCLVVCANHAPGFVTGYFEPVLQASPVETERFRYPLYACPEELLKTSSADQPNETASATQPYFDRSAIRQGALAGRGLELAWLENAIDQYFVHIQGSVRLEYPDHSFHRLSFAAKNGYPYTSIGAWLIEAGEIRRDKMSMTTLKNWLMENPAKCNEVMDRNRSYVFFQPYVGEDTDSGPVGASGIALTAGRSIAVDPAHHCYGTPIFVSVDQPIAAAGPALFRHLLVAQDTGSAIVGPSRGDLFIGSGAAAGKFAGEIRHDAKFHVLRPVGVGASHT